MQGKKPRVHHKLYGATVGETRDYKGVNKGKAAAEEKEWVTTLSCRSSNSYGKGDTSPNTYVCIYNIHAHITDSVFN